MLTSETVSLALLDAVHFAALKHSTQRRKDCAATPYINHPIAVAQLLARVGGVTDLVILQAGLLHDTIEDTETSPEELEQYFGEDVRRTVMEVTDDKALPKAERKRLQIEHAPHISAAGRQVKLADKICNIGCLTPDDPHEWSHARKVEYLNWAERVVAGCRGVNAALEACFDTVLHERRKALGVTAEPSHL